MKTALFTVLLAGFAVFSALVKHELRTEKSPLEALSIGQPMPDFTLTDRSGAKVTLSQVVKQNKIVAINFWASWCGPCRLEMPGFEKEYASKRAQGFALLAINEDERREAMDEYLTRAPVTFPVLLDTDGAVMKRFGVRALPTTVIVGGDGKIRMVTEGMQQLLGMFVDAELRTAAEREKKK